MFRIKLNQIFNSIKHILMQYPDLLSEGKIEDAQYQQSSSVEFPELH